MLNDAKEIFGEAYLFKDGQMIQICKNNQKIDFDNIKAQTL